MAPISANFLHFLTAIISISIPVIFTATVVEDLNNLQPPSDFNSTITKNCLTNPSLRYCNNATPFDDLHEIFKSTIVASHLCNISNNPNCIESFPKIDLRGQPKIAPLYLSFTFFWKYCPLTILSIDLSNNSLKDFQPGFFRSKHEFTPSILKASTDGFSERNLVRKTGRANIYRGVLRNGLEVRIEIYSDHTSRESRKRFVEKSKVLVQLQHKNIVPVLGWCHSRRFRATVTEWIDGENIETWLANSVPPWDQRVKIILGIAAGICYLNEEWPEVGYNLRTRNLLLSEDGEPLITRLFKLDDHHSSTKKAYKLGIFMLEIVTNRRPMEEFDKKETGFVEWVKMHYPENLEKVIDKRMKETSENVSEVIEFGLMCTDLSSGQQPIWDKICDLLSSISSTSRSSASPDHRSRAHRGHKHVHHR